MIIVRRRLEEISITLRGFAWKLISAALADCRRLSAPAEASSTVSRIWLSAPRADTGGQAIGLKAGAGAGAQPVSSVSRVACSWRARLWDNYASLQPASDELRL